MKPQLIRFVANGALATAIHSLAAYILIVRLDWFPGSANACAFLLATLTSYLGNTFWTFSAKHSPALLARYITVATCGSALSYLIASLIAMLGFPWWIGVAAIIVTVPIASWAAHKTWTYS